MLARDIMVAPVITVQPSASVQSVAELFVARGISGAPVVDAQGKLVGMISESDLLHRVETGSERRRSRWLTFLTDDSTLAEDYVRARASKVKDVMTRNVITASPATPVHEIATLLESKRIKRVPIVENNEIVGLVSRANLVQALAGARKTLEIPLSDSQIRKQLLDHLAQQPWAAGMTLNVTVEGGVVSLWGMVPSTPQRTAIRIAAESITGVTAVNDYIAVQTLPAI